MILKKLRNNHFLSFAGNVMMAALGMITYMLVAHNFKTKEELGYWFLFIFNTITLADVFRTGFLQNSLIKFYTGVSKDRAENIAGSAWYIGFWITMAACALNLVCYFLFYDTASEATRIMIQWFGITFLAMLPYSVALWILQAEGRFGILLILRAISQSLLPFFIVILIFTGHLTFRNCVYAHFLTCVITSIVSLTIGWDKIYTVKKRSKESVKELFHYGKFSVGTSIAAQLLKASDNYVINFMLMSNVAAAAVAVYSMAQQLMQVIEITIRSFTSTAMPMISAASNKGDDKEVVYVMKKFAGMMTLALIPICLVCFLGADILVTILGGKKYTGSEAALVFRIFMFIAILMPLDRFMGITLDMINKPRVNMIKVYIMLTVNVIADVVGLLIFHNIYGVALASIFTFSTGIVYGYWSLRKYLDFTIKDIFTLGYAELKELIGSLLRKKAGLE
ncbi:lipopolysaccharide biosynthesis protein [Mucilaginibacter mali]|uniref:Lipopolysaccharide biosynthesis protein n=1 Tax=Mucilaginibacter mali TaxID=2740462 RepID=A0A7D4QP24_9SPHI|nr:lipopolysaccharide biosynthesis protein [Mucilaginibacter mali]QKJ28309.1 lipopolysaccharide biosynthesis protein [Mucilaginibacter mali]